MNELPESLVTALINYRREWRKNKKANRGIASAKLIRLHDLLDVEIKTWMEKE